MATSVPVIPDADGPPLPPQQAETPTSIGASSSMSGGALVPGGIANLRQSVDERLLATSDERIKMIWRSVNGSLGALITSNGVLRCFVLGLSLEFFIMSLWLIIFGVLFVVIELKIPQIESVLKANVDFMYFPGFRAFFLTFVGTMQWWWWFGITTSCFCFLGAIFNFYVMKTHPAFGHSNTLQEYEPPVAPGHGDAEAGYGPAMSGDQYGGAKL